MVNGNYQLGRAYHEATRPYTKGQNHFTMILPTRNEGRPLFTSPFKEGSLSSKVIPWYLALVLAVSIGRARVYTICP